MKICVVLGTRPEIIKLSPIIRELAKKKINFFIIHTNQHYDYLMDRIFFEELELKKPKYELKIKEKTHGAMVGKMMIEIEKIIIKEKPDLIIVQGDTNSALAGALVASKLGIKLAHIEAGLRSFDRTMPEEINRVIVDHLADYLFAPTNIQKKLLLKEGIDEKKIFVVGNTIVDATFQNLEIAEDKVKKIDFFDKYFLLTLHRPSNVDNEDKFEKIIKNLEKISENFNIPVLFPIHPRTKINAKKFKISFNNKNFKLIEPVGYLNMLILEKNAKIIFTDSGGIQEEACLLKTPCITLRENTERPETIEVGANFLVGDDFNKIKNAVDYFFNLKNYNWKNPFGEDVGKKILFFLYLNNNYD